MPRRRLLLGQVSLTFVTAAAPALAPAAAEVACASLVKLALPHAKVTTAQSMPAGSKSPPGPDWHPPTAITLPPFCRVAAILTPSADSNIKMEAWLPEDWNGRFQMVGNGGFSGALTYPHMARALLDGYATASTDTGHSGSSMDGSFALHHPERLIDFGWRAVHETTVKAKAVIEAYYGKAPRYSYWNGCSSGGKQGLKEAQRFPEDYDGIIAGAPANNWMRLVAQQLWVARTTLPVGSPGYIPEAKYSPIFKAATAACDAIDGVEDGAIEDPRQCPFEPKQLQCMSDDDPQCLTAAQVASVERLYAPLRNPRTGQYIHAGLARGSELMWGWVGGGPGPFPIAEDAAKYIVFENPQWDYRTFDFDRDLERALQIDGGNIDATDPNLGAFRARGGKLIQYHGWNDAGIAPGDSIDYYEKVIAHQRGADRATQLAETQSFYRLFMVPGMNHCVPGGPGADYFDMLPVLARWVERGEAPDRIVAAKFKDGNWVDQKLQGKEPQFHEPYRSGKPDATRPLCPYPAVARWTGQGDTGSAAHFACLAGPPAEARSAP